MVRGNTSLVFEETTQTLGYNFSQNLANYVAADLIIEPSMVVRDLGVYMNQKMNWSSHYSIIIKKSKRMCGWILGSFYSRGKESMLLLFKSLVRSTLEYCCEVWFPHLKKDIVDLEQVQRSFTHRISGQKESNYWERLKDLKIFSLQRRREKIVIMHIWKIKNKIYPNTIQYILVKPALVKPAA